MIIITSIDSVLGELSRLEGHPRLPSLLTVQIKNLQLEIRFLKVFFWCFAKWDDATKDASLGPPVTDIAAQLRKAGQGLYAAGLIAIQRNQIEKWETVASNLLGKVEHCKPEIEKICLDLLDRSFECNFSTSSEILDFIGTILENLKDLVISKAIFNGPMENQIIALEEILKFLSRFVDFTATRTFIYEKLEDCWNHVQGCTNKAACISILLWVRVMDEQKIDSVLSDLRHKIEPFTPEVTKMYLGVLKASKLSPSDTSLMGQVVATFVDSLLKNLPVPMKDYVPVLGSGLMFLITFLIDPPTESKVDSIWTEFDDIVSNAASFICSFGIDQTRVHIADEWNKFLHELLQKIDIVKADIKKQFFQDSVSLSDFPRTNGLGFIDFLLGKIDEMLKSNNLDVDTFAKYQIETIQRQLQDFQIILELQNGHEELEDIRMQIINVAYTAEHVIDYSLVMNAPIWYRMVHLSDVIEQMKLIKLNIEKVEAKQMDDIRVLNDDMESRNDLLTEANVSRIDDVFVGFEDVARTIIDQLTSGSNQLEIVSILGMPGGGKTTLAKKIFNSPVILSHFEIYAWCYVSQVHSRRNSLLNILNHNAALDDLTSELSDGQLAERLYEYLKHRRFLIVLDDIWDIKAWDELRSSFPNNDNGSRILLTSRIHNVALQANSDKLHFLRPLSDEECYKLLKIKLFQNDVCPPELSKVGQQIAKNCKGLPLAVVLIAGILATEERHVDFWEQIAQNLSSHIASEGCMDILELSYKYLPDVLKSCFLYFGTFQMGMVIKVKKLIRLWSAEGLIQETGSKSLEDVANDYLMDLVNRSLLSVDSRSFNQRIKKCHVHDLLHCLCVTKGEEEGFFQLLNTSQLQSNGMKYKQYRLCIHTEWRAFVNSKPTGLNVRSLLFNSNNSSNGHPYAPEFFNGFQLLRVLDLEALQWGVLFPVEIFLLVHLRYLAVVGDFTSIPSSIDSLPYLETLLVKSYGSIIVLPHTIFHVKRLMHVDIPTGATVSWDDFELEKSNLLSNLVTFSSLYVSSREDAEMLLRLSPKVRILRFQFYNKFPALDFLNNLESLKVHKIGRAPYPYSSNFPSTLRELTLSNLGLPWEAMSAIGELPSLEALKLLSRSFEGPCWNMRDVLRLKFLKLESLNITKWKAYNESLPCLQQLVVKNCSMLEEIPYSFAKIPTLKIIEVRGCQSSVAKSTEIILQELQDLRNDEIQAIMTPELRKGQHHSFSDIIEVPGCHSSVAESANILEEHEDLGNDESQGIMTLELKKGQHPSFSDVKEDLTSSKEIKKSRAILRGPNKFLGDNREEASRIDKMVNELARTPIQDGYVSYPWERRMVEMLSVPSSSSFYSMLLLPKASDKVAIRYNDLEDTLARANAWLNASQASGVPIVFMNIQTESLLTKISGETASSTVSAGSLSDLSNLASASLYGFEDYHGVDIGEVRAVRLWFSPLGGEIPIEIKLQENDTKLGFDIRRTEEGFIYISSVVEGDDEAPSSRSGLGSLYKEATRECKLLVISRISNQKVLPWMVSPSGAVRCFDTVSLSQKLSLHRHAKVPIILHLFLWDPSVRIPGLGSIRSRAISPTVLPLAPEVHLARRPNENQVKEDLTSSKEIKKSRAILRGPKKFLGDNREEASRIDRMVNELARTPIQDGYVSYPWERRMVEMPSVPSSSSFYSMLLLPKASDKVAFRYNDLEDTLARANAWLNASQASGVPIVFMNIQTESLLTKISGETASSTVSAGSLSDLSNLASASLYGFENYHGVDIGVVRAVRLWFSPLGGEIPIEIKLQENDTKLGFAISRTEEGFIYISSVIEGDDEAPSSRSGLGSLCKEATRECKLLVVSRISNQRVLPWMVSPSGAVRCFDTVSLSQKLSLHRHAKVPITLHLFLWDRSIRIPGLGSIRSRAISPTVLPLAPEVQLARRPNEN